MTGVYRDWINSPEGHPGRPRCQARVVRLVHGNLGRHRNLAGGVAGLKIVFGPGYRVYSTPNAVVT
jgi:putative addiction module killer protein